MGVRELKNRYGRSLRTNQAFNRAIRAEVPGGSALLDALGLVGGRADYDKIEACLLRARAEMSSVIAEKYELQSTHGDQENE